MLLQIPPSPLCQRGRTDLPLFEKARAGRLFQRSLFGIFFELWTRNYKICIIRSSIYDRSPRKDFAEMTITVDDIIKLAIEKEDNAYKLYSGILDKISDPGAKAMISQLAREELEHKEALERLDVEKARHIKPQKIEDLKIAEFLKDRKITDTSSLQDVLVFAMKREKESYEFYSKFAAEMADPEIKNVLEAFAQQELKHKRDLEAFYDDVIYQED